MNNNYIRWHFFTTHCVVDNLLLETNTKYIYKTKNIKYQLILKN